MNMDDESRLRSESSQVFDSSCSSMAEAKICALVNAANAEILNQDTAHKLGWRQAGKRRFEFENQDGIDPCPREQPHPLVERRQ
jgi:hypothetical protein